ncbi:HAD family hydrolase [Streptomyces sp. NL15-2K]|uniref:HAD family hydrolase n=1 Tax=Streptomyces sp. NL15-2K TaxID=376149 RepID=UPI000F55E10F|nr:MULTISPECIES: HAD family hydrolase [Actinomycetes]WKX06245.1 HAD family hydrolase [Kutzneria buriramensis]GCB52897.1 5'-nucleotidase yjjG [Streptomyces sp. NL15-2K]
MQRLALFDLDNTLVDRRLAFSVWAGEFADERELGGEAARWLIAADRQGARPRDQFFRAVRDHFGLVEPADELWAAFRARMPDLVRCEPRVLDGLSQLRASGWRVAIVSNGMADNQLMKIERSGLRERVDACCVSGEVGIRKPDVQIFQLAAERCGRALAEGGWMIGDNPEHDIAGGRAAGLRTMWVGEQHAWPRGELRADRTVVDAVAAISRLQSFDT